MKSARNINYQNRLSLDRNQSESSGTAVKRFPAGLHPMAILVSCLLLWIASPAAWAATITVCGSGCNQTTIGAAINAASPGDTIMIGSGTYYESIVISKNLTLHGAGSTLTIIDGQGVSTPVTVPTGVTAELDSVTVQAGERPGEVGILVQGSLTLADSIVTNNALGILNSGGTLTILRTTISNNVDRTYGAAGIFNDLSGTTNVFSSTITGNNGEWGGGLGLSSGSIALSNSTLSGDTAIGGSEVSFQNANDASVQLGNSTIVNTTQQPSISGLSGTTNTLIFNNSILVSPPGIPNCFSSVNLLSLGHNLSSDATCDLVTSTDIVNSPYADLGPLQINLPGTTATQALLPGSAAIDTGDCSGGFVPNDERGVSRPQGSACDIGAYELRTPIANNDSYKTTPGQTLIVAEPGIMTNDVSPEGLPLYISGATGTVNGTLYIYSGGNFQYVPNAGFVGLDGFSYTVSDGVHSSNTATVAINVQPVNQPPVAENDSYSLFAGQTLTVDVAHGVLANDSDSDGDPLTAVDVSLPTHGKLSLNSDGSFAYTPATGFTGIDSFTYEALDGQTSSNVATVSLTVNPNVSTITIALVTQPQEPKVFHFTGGLGKFALGGANAISKSVQVAAGTYTINETVPSGWLLGNITCDPLSGVVVDLTHDRVQLTMTAWTSVTCTFIDQKPGKATARVYNDHNHDHKREGSDPWLTGWTIQLYSAPGVMVASQITNAVGEVIFTNLAPTTYTACEVLQANWYTITPTALDPTYGMGCYTISVSPAKTNAVSFGVSTTQP
jgi:hypothetical protein